MIGRVVDGRSDLPWSMNAIHYRDIAHEAVEDDELLFQIVASASFVEITSDLYTRNLTEYFRDDHDLVDWLAYHWEPEELQHGAALKRYVETAWPWFDWEQAYAGFFAEYSRCCLLEKNFFYFFRRYRESENPGRTAVLRTLWDRAQEVDAEDGYMAFKHVFRASKPEAEFRLADYEAFRSGVRRIGREYFPCGMALKMFLKPLDLAPVIGRVVLPSAAAATRLWLLW